MLASTRQDTTSTQVAERNTERSCGDSEVEAARHLVSVLTGEIELVRRQLDGYEVLRRYGGRVVAAELVEPAQGSDRRLLRHELARLEARIATVSATLADDGARVSKGSGPR